MDAATLKDLSVALAFGIGAVGPAIAIGMIGAGALNALGRNPEAKDDIRAFMILAIAFAEALAIFAFVIAMILNFL
ncbi:MAG TPA: ATP synthase F0 subunit C [bacterium]|nr:ATP synthase F0 subunit C [bacterium]